MLYVRISESVFRNMRFKSVIPGMNWPTDQSIRKSMQLYQEGSKVDDANDITSFDQQTVDVSLY